jgi:PST family polysaccharide transporter
MFKNRVVKNTGWLIFEHIFRMILSLLVTSIVARYLGTYNYGLINYGLAYITIFLNISSLGIDSILVYEIVSNEKKTGEMIGTAMFMRVISSLISVIFIYTIVSHMNSNNSLLVIITFIQSISIIFASFDLLKYWFQSNLNSKYVVLSKLIAFTLVSSWRIILVALKVEVEYFAIATIIETFTAAVVLFISYYKHRGPTLKIKLSLMNVLLKKSYLFIVAGLLVSIYTQIDKIMLGKMFDISSVGIYTAAMNIAGLWIFIPMAIIESLRPLIMKEKNVSQERYEYLFSKLNSIIIWISIAAAISITLLSKYIIIIIYGRGFLESTPILIILVWSRIFSLLGTTRTIWLISENLKRYVNVLVGIGAIINFSMNLYLIPIYGALGAAIATIIAEFISSFLVLYILRDTKPLAKMISSAFLHPLKYLK